MVDMSANDRQVGGQHYKTGYEHWDLVIRCAMGYLEGNATRYIARWRKKDGITGLRKAMHYMDKLIESYEIQYVRTPRPMTNEMMNKEIVRFVLINGLDMLEQEFIHILCTYTNRLDLQAAKLVLEEIIENAELEQAKLREEINRPGTPEDGGHHATTD